MFVLLLTAHQGYALRAVASPLRTTIAVRASVPTASLETLETRASGFPTWPESAIAGRRELATVIELFEQNALSVPLNAGSANSDGYRTWMDGGFAAHRFINQKLSRQTYVPILLLLLHLMVGVQQKFPDLYAVLKFVPKKNGLNPLLAKLQAAEHSKAATEAVRIDQLRPREVRRL